MHLYCSPLKNEAALEVGLNFVKTTNRQKFQTFVNMIKETGAFQCVCIFFQVTTLETYNLNKAISKFSAKGKC